MITAREAASRILDKLTDDMWRAIESTAGSCGVQCQLVLRGNETVFARRLASRATSLGFAVETRNEDSDVVLVISWGDLVTGVANEPDPPTP